MNPFKKLWFWLLLISIVLFIASMILFESMGSTNTNNSASSNYWIYALMGVSLVILIISFVLYVMDVISTRKKMEIAIACGEIKPQPVKKIECPKKCEPKPECPQKQSEPTKQNEPPLKQSDPPLKQSEKQTYNKKSIFEPLTSDDEKPLIEEFDLSDNENNVVPLSGKYARPVSNFSSKNY